jgi:hypothetical protein
VSFSWSGVTAGACGPVVSLAGFKGWVLRPVKPIVADLPKSSSFIEVTSRNLGLQIDQPFCLLLGQGQRIALERDELAFGPLLVRAHALINRLATPGLEA